MDGSAFKIEDFSVTKDTASVLFILLLLSLEADNANE